MAARRYLESSRDEAFQRAVAMWDHPRRILDPSMQNLRDVFRIEGNRDTYVVPNTRLLRGLRQLSVIGDRYFLPANFMQNIVQRAQPYGSLTSDESYAWTSYRYLHNPVHGVRSAYTLIDGNNELVLEFPLNDVYDLPAMLFLYILDVMTGLRNGGVYHAEFSIDPIDDIRETMKVLETVKKNRGHGGIDLQDVIRVYNAIISAVYSTVHGYDHIARRSSWNGSDESGTRIILLLEDNRRVYVRIKLRLVPGLSGHVSTKWTENIQKLLDEMFPTRCYLTVCNKEDPFCLVYCIMLGVMCHQKRLWMTRVEKTIDCDTILCRALYDDANGKASHKLQVLAKSMLEGENPLAGCDIEYGKEYSIQDLRTKMKAVEDKILDDDIACYALDVYMVEVGTLKHIYPVYMSKKVKPLGRISVLSVQDGKGCGHYILATNLEEMFSATGGKIFFNCSKCGMSFFTRGAYNRHEHYRGEKGDEESMHWSRNGVKPDTVPKGYCWRCMLKFPTEFEAKYHSEHCFMMDKTGYRYVKCIENDSMDLPVLRGVKYNKEKEEEKQKNVYLLFADFESTIDPLSGEHQVMSWGLYDAKEREFDEGFDLGEFMLKLYNIACRHSRIHVYFHNAMNYDANFILRYVLSTPWCARWNINPIMKSTNRMQKLSFQFTDGGGHSHVLDIGDTFLFLTLSLDRIVSSLKKDTLEGNKEVFPRFFEEFHKKYPFVNDDEINMILKKNLFPYRFFDSMDRLNTKREDFLKIFEGATDEDVKCFSENVTREDLAAQYPFVQRVMDTYKCETARDYHDIYLMCDVMEIADVFLRTIEVLWESHHVFLPNYIGMPAASWAAFLRHDPTMEIPLYSSTLYAEFFSTMIRGGVTSAPMKYAKSDETHSIIYLDVNGLYPYVMQAYKYPCGYFMWVTFDSVPEGMDLNKYLLEDVFPELERNEDGMALTVDLHYTRELKDRTNGFPFAPEHRLIYDEFFDDNGELKDYLQSWSAANEGAKMTAFKGLVGTLYDKTQYTVHWRLLKWYIEHGLIVTKLWWGVRFHESSYLHGYTHKNIELRNKVKDELRKMLYKLMGNSVFGKTMESVFRRGVYMIIRDPKILAGVLEEGHVSSITPVDQLGWIVKMDGEEIVLDKPTYIGACICEYAKLHMYELFYDKLRSIFEEVELVYTDTDSVIVYITHPPELHDPKALFGYIKEKMPDLIGGLGGQVKSEVKDEEGNDDIIEEVIALRSKVYAYRTRSGYVGKRAKGTTHAAQEGQLDWEAYKAVLESRKNKYTSNMQFKRTGFEVFSTTLVKNSLGRNDGKREDCADGIHTLAWGFK